MWRENKGDPWNECMDQAQCSLALNTRSKSVFLPVQTGKDGEGQEAKGYQQLGCMVVVRDRHDRLHCDSAIVVGVWVI